MHPPYEDFAPLRSPDARPRRAGRSRLVAAMLFLLTSGCGDAFGPGTDWLEGSWALTLALSGMGIPIYPDRPDALVLELGGDGWAAVWDHGAVVQRTTFRAERDDAQGGRPIILRFDDRIPLAGVNWDEYGVSTTPGDHITMGVVNHGGCRDCDHNMWFARIP
jgi:hypothetical protein